MGCLELERGYEYDGRNRSGDHFIAATPIDDPTPDPDVPVSYVTLSQSELSLSVGSYKRLEYTVFPTNATNQTVSWSSSDPRVATVENGMVHAIAAGMARITVKTQDGGYTAECVITVNGNLEGEASFDPQKESCPFKSGKCDLLRNPSISVGFKRKGIGENVCIGRKRRYVQRVP